MTILAGLKLLLVEDEFLIALDAEHMLRELGASEISVACNFDEAQQLISTNTFDLALLDVNLNGQKSFPLAQQLFRRGTAIVFATGYNLDHQPMEGYEGGAVVLKPYTALSLRKALVSALEKSKEKSKASQSNDVA